MSVRSLVACKRFIQRQRPRVSHGRPRTRHRPLALQDRVEAGAGWAGHCLPGRRSPSEPSGGDEGAAAGAGRERRGAPALRSRGAAVLRPRQPEHRRHLRHGGSGRALLHRHAVRRGDDAQGADRGPAAGDASRPLDRHPDRGRSRGRTRQRDRTPRHQTFERNCDHGRPGQGPGLRPGQAAGGPEAGAGRRRLPDRRRRALRLPGLRLARAGHGPARGPPVGRVQPGRRALPDGHRPPAVPGEHAPGAHPRRAAPGPRAHGPIQPAGADGAAAHPRARAGQGPRRPPSDDGRPARRAQGPRAAARP